jgi:hypothetical protein
MSRLVAERLTCGWLIASKGRTLVLILRFFAATILSAAPFLAGCTDASIARARHQIAEGDYVEAHEYYATEAAKSEDLSVSQRREVLDGLCLTEYQIGAPTYPLSRQLRSCATALNEPGSESSQIYSKVARKEREGLTSRIEEALAQRDIASADEAILHYRAIPGNDPRLAATWTRQLWIIVNQETVPSKTALTPSIAQLSRQFRHQQNMTDRQFRQWVEHNMTVGGNLMVTNVEIGQRTVDLWLGKNQLAEAALNLDRFARINDGLVARCRCSGLTKVALQDSGLPAYLVRLNPASRQSEVLILDQP